jgi:uncharacterized protein YycO
MKTSSGNIFQKIAHWVVNHIIKWYQYGNPLIHSGIVLNFEEKDFNRDNPYVVEAVEQGIVEEPSYTKGNLRYFQLLMNEEQSKLFPSIIKKYLGDPYDTRGLLSFLLRHKESVKNEYFCSELVYQIGNRELGLDIFNKGCGIEPYMVNPSMLLMSNAKEV